ncbi:putative acetyltransferase [Povalibacter uvarum]|uniref:Putative acetyltransferase n=1 Tax=Povalibacter uvarum TaxID=732238 RepID=A0A841HPS2_9GAMM|nr:GNAT family N-acetyltransferase [Povalibacter uvarum]MBB6094240.1 putative acetyltransferase [Povalibacter uvarum]
MKIRPYRETDTEALALLFTRAVHGLAGRDYDERQLKAWAPQPPDLDFWGTRLTTVRTLVAEENSEPVGFISYEQNGHIDLLYASPQSARQGVASALYRETEALLLSSGIRELFTEASTVARPFFESRGFQVTEEQRVELHGITFRRFGMRKVIAGHGE